MKTKMTKAMCTFICAAMTTGALNAVSFAAFAEETTYPTNYSEYEKLLESCPDFYRNDGDSVYFINPMTNSMTQKLIVNSNQTSEVTNNTYGYIFKPQKDGVYAVSTESLTEDIITIDSENSYHFHYFYPVITNYKVTVQNGEITVEKDYSKSYYSEEQINAEKEKKADITEPLVCYDVMAINEDEVLGSEYYSWVNGVIPGSFDSYISTVYNEYYAESYFCLNLSYSDVVTDEPIVNVSDHSVGQLLDPIPVSSSMYTDDIMNLYRIKAVQDGGITVTATGNTYYLIAENDIFRLENNNAANGTWESGIYILHYQIVDDTYVSITGYDYNNIDFVLTEELYIPDNIQGYPVGAIAPYAFGISEEAVCEPCYAEKLIIDSKYEGFTIGESAFRNCYDLNEVILPENLTTIGKEAFYRCDELREITIPKSVTEIGDNALGYTEGRVYVPGEDGIIDYPSMMPLNDFIIYGYNGTEAERYADDNGLIFESLDATGDLNGDGELTMKDHVSIQKYLTGQKTLSKGELSRADICTDGRVNCFDLAEMKTEIINKRRNSDFQITIDQHFSLVSERAGSNAVIRSKNEMIDFLQDYIPREDILAYSAKYNDEFFKENVLLLGAVFQSTGTKPLYEVSIDGFYSDTLYVSYWCPPIDEPVDDVISRLIIQIVVPKEQFTFDNIVWLPTPSDTD